MMLSDGKRLRPGFAVLDFETNGLGPWEDILEIGIVFLDADFKVESQFSTLVHSSRVKNPWAHGIDTAQLLDAPHPNAAVPYLFSLLSGRYVVAHNAGFEKRFLVNHGANHGLLKLDAFEAKLIDTMPIAQELCGKRKLTEVSKFLELEHKAHQALDDAYVAAVILQKAAEGNSAKLAKQLAEASIWPEAFSISERMTPELRMKKDELLAHRSSWIPREPQSTHENNQAELEVYQSAVQLFSLNFDLSSQEKEVLLALLTEHSIALSSAMVIHQEVLENATKLQFPAQFMPRREYLLTNLANVLGLTVDAESLAVNGSAPSILKNDHRIMLSGRLSGNQDVLARELEQKGLTLTKDVASADVMVISHQGSSNRQIQEARNRKIPVLVELSFTIFLG